MGMRGKWTCEVMEEQRLGQAQGEAPREVEGL